ARLGTRVPPTVVTRGAITAAARPPVPAIATIAAVARRPTSKPTPTAASVERIALLLSATQLLTEDAALETAFAALLIQPHMTRAPGRPTWARASPGEHRACREPLPGAREPARGVAWPGQKDSSETNAQALRARAQRAGASRTLASRR